MCTLSWWYHDNRMHILFNRDERKARAPARWPEHYQQSGVEAIMPLDPEGEGSWVAANALGQVFCLLNDYTSAVEDPTTALQSRGKLVRSLAHSKTWAFIDAMLQPEQLRCYAPFRLVIFTGLQEPLLWHWNGSELRQQSSPSSPLSSSSALPRLIPALRARYWRRKMSQAASLQTQRQLHQQARPWHAFSGIAMQRQQVETVSVTQVDISTDSITMHYWDGHPSQHAESPDKTIQLSLSDAAPAADNFSTQLQVQSLLQRYNPALSNRLSAWQWRLLRWLLAEQRLNRALQELNQQPAERFCDLALQRLNLTPNIVACRWPAADSRPVFVCNHPTGGIDGLLLISVLQKRYPDLLVLANEVLAEVQQLATHLVPVPVFGKPQHALPAVQQAFASDAPLLIFPAGRTARKQANGALDDGPWAKLTATLARRQQRPITVLHLHSQNSRWFYLLARLRTVFGISANLEMLLLVREMLKPATKQPRLYVDVPMQPIELNAIADHDKQRMAWLKRRSYQLPTIYQEDIDAAIKPSCSRRAS